MKKLFFLLAFCSAAVFSQNYNDSLTVIQNQFKSFQYAEVIKTSLHLLKNKNIPSETEKTIYLLKAISHFALSEDTLAKYTFIEILKKDPLFVPDSVTTSPKVISFFNSVKEGYPVTFSVREIPVINEVLKLKRMADSVYFLSNRRIKGSVTRSLLFPGLGHLYLKDKKGWYFAVPAALSLVSSIYFSFETSWRKDDYMNARFPSDISDAYRKYNTAYQIRNYSIAVFAAVWVISQFDILSSDYYDFHTSSGSSFILASVKLPL